MRSSLTPQNGRIVGRKMHSSNKTITVVKKQHTLKNTIIATTAKVILFVGRTFSGHHHDYTMLKAEFPPDYDWFAALSVLVDLGYLGIRTDYTGAEILVPHKKPRKSQRNPQPTLTPAQKADNRAISKLRVAIEQAIAGIKRYNILVHRFRNRRPAFHDDVIALCAGLWNFALIY